MKPGDVLSRVNGKNVAGRTIRELRGTVPGPLGSSVNLGFSGEGGSYDVGELPIQNSVLLHRKI